MLNATLDESTLTWLRWSAVLSTALLAAISDARTRRIPNALTYPMLALGLAQAIALAGPRGAADALLGCFLASLPFVLLFLFAGGGAGDAKLMGALGAWLGAVQSLTLLLAVSVMGVLFAVFYARRHRRLAEVAGNLVQIFWQSSAAIHGGARIDAALRLVPTGEAAKLRMPYGIPIFLGTVLAMAMSLA